MHYLWREHGWKSALAKTSIIGEGVMARTVSLLRWELGEDGWQHQSVGAIPIQLKKSRIFVSSWLVSASGYLEYEGDGEIDYEMNSSYLFDLFILLNCAPSPQHSPIRQIEKTHRFSFLNHMKENKTNRWLVTKIYHWSVLMSSCMSLWATPDKDQ